MISCDFFYNLLKGHGTDFICGVPDSLLADFCNYLSSMVSNQNHIITANEGNAIGLASGYHLATGKIGLVYMQNSGLGNCVNPLASLTDSEVYNIPVLLLIGWRGEPGFIDEPQHIKQGKITIGQLELLGIPYSIAPDSESDFSDCIESAYSTMNLNNCPFAIIIKKNLFSPFPSLNRTYNSLSLLREEAIITILESLNEKDILISTTGKISREVFDYRERKKQGHDSDFLTVGSMGHCSSIALGVALQHPKNRIFCFDGDGSVIMHMGALATIGGCSPVNFKHVIFNNGSHDSVGGQPTVGLDIDLLTIAKSCNYNSVFRVETYSELVEVLGNFIRSDGPSLLEVRVKKGSRDDLPRPSLSPYANKKNFMNFFNRTLN